MRQHFNRFLTLFIRKKIKYYIHGTNSDKKIRILKTKNEEG